MERYIKTIVIPFIAQKRKVLKLGEKHLAMVLFDMFQGQTTSNMHSLLAANNIVSIQLPPNYTDKLQLLDLSVNKPVKFSAVHVDEVKRQLQTIPVKQIKVDVNLAV